MNRPCAGSRGSGRLLLILVKDANTFLVEIVELPAIDGPAQHTEDEQDQDDRQREEQIEDVHLRILLKSRAGVQGARSRKVSGPGYRSPALPGAQAQGIEHHGQ